MINSEVDAQIREIRLGKQSAWRTMDRGSWYYTGGSEPNHPKEKKCKTKWLSEEALQTAEERREVKGKGERESYIQLNAEV